MALIQSGATSDNVTVDNSTDDKDQTQVNSAISNREGNASVTAAPQDRAGEASGSSEDSAAGNKTECFGDEVLWAGHCYPYNVGVDRGYIREGDSVSGGLVVEGINE